MARGAASVLVATGLISATTAVTRVSQVPLRALAATPQSLAEGRIWLLATSALLADRPAFASILGFLVVGLAAVWLCGSRVVWIAAATGHVFSAVIVYVGIGLVRLAEPGAFQSAFGLRDFGTSAIIAAWIGAIAYWLWARRRRAQAISLCLVSALAGWYCKGTLTVLDWEHLFALGAGIATLRYAAVLDLRPRPGLKPDAVSSRT
jgi:hypothetical protein